MTVARDAVLEFTAFGATPQPATLSFTPTGTPRGITVLIAHGAVLTDLITGVTYGGVAMDRFYMGTVAGAEGGNIYAYFLGSGIPTGTQTVSIGHTGTSTVKWAVVQSVTAAADTELGAVGQIGTNSRLDPSILLDSGPVSALRVGLFWSGLDDPASLTPLAGMEAVAAGNSHDFGTVVALLAEQTTASAGAFTLGYTAAAEDSNAVGFSIQEIPVDGYPHTSAPALTVMGGATSHLVRIPAQVDAGDLLLMVFSSGTVVVNTPAGWTLLSNLAPGFELNIFYKIADGSEGGTTVDVTTGASVQAVSQTFRIADWHGTTPPEAGVPVGASTTTPNPPSLTPSWGAADTLWFAIANAGASSVYPTDYPDNYGNGTASFQTSTGATGLAVAVRKLNAASDDPSTFTFSALTATIAQTVAVRPAAPPPVPAAPTSLTATAVSDTAIDLAWIDNATDETGYRVERSLTGVGAWSDISGALAVGATTYSDTGLTAETEYFYRIYAFNAQGDSLPSNTDSATTQATPIPPPASGNRMGGTGAVRKPPR